MIADRVIATIATVRKMSPEDITVESNFVDLGMDSLDAFEFLFALEEEFNISIPDDVAKEMETVGQAVEALENLLGDSGDTDGTGADG